MKTVFILSDSYRRDHLGLYNRAVHTPNLDRLAATACVFDQAYVGSFPTGPNRRDVMLGRGPAPGCAFNPWKNLEASETPFAHRLSEAGVCTQMITDVANQVTRGANLMKGFQYYLVNRGQEGDGYSCNQDVDVTCRLPKELVRYGAHGYGNVLLNRARRRIEDDWFAPRTFRWACEWLEQNWKRDDFFLWVETFDPHEPWDPPPYYVDRYDPGYRGRVVEFPPYGYHRRLGITDREVRHLQARYAGECTMVDHAVGRLLATLEKLGLLDETAVFFTSDHGINAGLPGDAGLVGRPWVVEKDLGAWLVGGSFALKNPQWLPMRTGTMRLPLLIKMPGQRRARRIARIAQPWDLAPTILDLFGQKAPPERQGESLLPVMRGGRRPPRPYAFNGHYMGKTHLAQAMNAEWIYAVWPGGEEPPWLIDLRRDPKQLRNAAARHPDVCRRMHDAVARFDPEPFRNVSNPWTTRR